MPKELRRIPKQMPKAERGRFSAAEWEAERERRQELASEWRAENCWHPNQLRHNAATKARRSAGLETAQVICGHSKADVTQVYAEADRQKAIQYMAQHG